MPTESVSSHSLAAAVKWVLAAFKALIPGVVLTLFAYSIAPEWALFTLDFNMLVVCVVGGGGVVGVCCGSVFLLAALAHVANALWIRSMSRDDPHRTRRPHLWNDNYAFRIEAGEGGDYPLPRAGVNPAPTFTRTGTSGGLH